MKITLVSRMWNADLHGFPWRETFSELLYHDQEVVCTVGENDDPSCEAIKRWAKVEPGLKVCSWHDPVDIHKQHEMVRMAAAEATGEYLLMIDADEIVEIGPLLEWLSAREDILNETPCTVGFRRHDFTYSTRLATDIYLTEHMTLAKLTAARWFPKYIWPTNVAGNFEQNPPTHVCHLPLFHYHGLLSEEGNREKELQLQTGEHNREAADRYTKPEWLAENDAKPWDRFTKPGGPVSRSFPFAGKHPKVMWPWLSRAEMHWRGL